MAYIKVRVLDTHWCVKHLLQRIEDKVRTEHVLGVWFIILFGLLLVYSCSAAGSGPDYKGPGIEIDVDHNKKTPKSGYKAPGGTSKRR